MAKELKSIKLNSLGDKGGDVFQRRKKHRKREEEEKRNRTSSYACSETDGKS